MGGGLENLADGLLKGALVYLQDGIMAVREKMVVALIKTAMKLHVSLLLLPIYWCEAFVYGHSLKG
jgi:hypothetical protein